MLMDDTNKVLLAVGSFGHETAADLVLPDLNLNLKIIEHHLRLRVPPIQALHAVRLSNSIRKLLHLLHLDGGEGVSWPVLLVVGVLFVVGSAGL